MSLAKLKKIDLRKAWKHEALDFTLWLSEEENLRLLGDEVGYGIKLIQTEAAVGNFNVDILAEDEDSDKRIVIENQLEKTDHQHLGKIITYASGHDAKVIIWVVESAQEEHRQAVDWLNENTNESVEFYLVKIELWQIDGSPFAPKFEIVSKPNDWAKTVKDSAGRGQLTETKIKQLDFWSQFKDYAQRNRTRLRFQKPSPQHWTNISIGSGKAHLSLTIDSKKGMFGTEIYIPDNKELFEKLLERKKEIESDLGEKMLWMDLPGRKASRLRIVYQGNFEDQEKWETIFEWLLREAEKFGRVFPKYIK